MEQFQAVNREGFLQCLERLMFGAFSSLALFLTERGQVELVVK